MITSDANFICNVLSGFGVTITQTCLYFARFPKDNRTTKWVVSFLLTAFEVISDWLKFPSAPMIQVFIALWGSELLRSKWPALDRFVLHNDVWTTRILNTLDTSLNWHMIYHYLVSGYNDPATLLQNDWWDSPSALILLKSRDTANW